MNYTAINNVLGIICEYNPFHNGHLSHIEKSKKLTNATHTIVLMSGNFTQRSEPAIIDKWSRAEMAILNGVDLVIELPNIFATASAEDFAYGAIKIFKELKIVSKLSFGSECGDIKKLENLADLFLIQPEEFMYHLENALSTGISYPSALSKATDLTLKSKVYSSILNNPNNVLGIEYIKQIKQQNFPVTAITIQRTEPHNTDDNSTISNISSGSRIRKAIIQNEEFKQSVPQNVYNILLNNLKYITTSSLKPFEDILFYNILTMSLDELANIQDVSEGLENRIKKAAFISKNYEELVSNIKSKRYTKSKVRRILLNILLKTTKKDMHTAKSMKPYIRVLGFNNKGKDLIKLIAENNPKLDIIVSVSSFEKENTNKSKSKIFNKDILSTDLYSLSTTPYLPIKLDYTQKVVYVNNDKN